MSYAAEISRSVVRYEPADRPALRAFQGEHYGAISRHCDDEFFEWLFERNPHRDPAGASVWLCKRDGVVVAQQASIPTLLKIGDSEHRAAWLIDWMVHPEWRLKGVSPALFAANANSTDIMLGLGLEEMAYRSVRRAGWSDAGRLTLFVRPLDGVASAKILNLPPLLGKLAPRFIVGGSARFIAGVGSALARVSLEPVCAFDERIDALWDTVSREHQVVAKRDFEMVRWRFDQGPHRVHYDRYYLTRKGAVVGYAVLRVTDWRGHRIGRVVDYFTGQQWVTPLLALVMGELDRKGVAAVFLEQWDARAEKTLRSLGCMRARPSHRFMFKARETAPAGVADTLAHASNWFVTPADSDFDHVLIGPHGDDAAAS
jgi:GNAT superfamily N-acetyltransferase